MYAFSHRSLNKLTGVHPDLVRVVRRAMDFQIMDFSVVEGARTLDRQKELVERGASRTMRSKHLFQSTGYSHAVDLYPYPIDMRAVRRGDNREISRFGMLCGIMMTAAKLEKVSIINGMDWDGDGQTLDHNFFDAPHYEIEVLT